MHAIQATLKPASKSAEVANLQEALRWLYAHGVFKTFDPPNRPTTKELKALFGKLASEESSQSFGEATRKVLVHFQVQQGLGDNLYGVVEAVTAERLNKLLVETGAVFDEGQRVFGSVTDMDGVPQAGVLVTVWDRDLRRRQLLGRAKTDAVGSYAIPYKPADFSSADPGSRSVPWLIVEVQRREGDGVLNSVELKPSQVSALQRVDMQIPKVVVAMEAEHVRIATAVLPLLQGQGSDPVTDLPPYELGSADWPFLAEETGFAVPALQAYADGNRMVRDALALLPKDDAEFIELLIRYGGGYFFAMARQGLAGSLTDALQRGPGAWSRAWTGALGAKQVAAVDDAVLSGLARCVDRLRNLQQIQPSPRATQPVAKVLAITDGKVPAQVALTAHAAIERQGRVDPDQILATLSQEHPGQAAANATLVRSLRLHQLTDGSADLMRALTGHLDGDGDTLVSLAKLSPSDWVRTAGAAGVSAAVGLDMQRRIELQYPARALQMRLEAGRVQFGDTLDASVPALLKDRPERVDALMAGKTPVLDATLDETEIVLKNLGTSLRLGLNMDLAGHFARNGYLRPADFLNADIDTLGDVANEHASEIDYRDLLKDHREKVEQFVEAGRDLVITTGSHWRVPGWNFEIDPPVSDTLTDEERGNLPDIPALFGDLDECVCRPCESMLGQRAYLVDLLELLKEEKQAKRSECHEALKKRRSDIFLLPLDCENGEKVVTHVELVLEILEGARASGSHPVYEQTATALFPWTLPFDRDWAEATAYFNALGIFRDDCLRLLDAGPERRAAVTLDIPRYHQSPSDDVEWSLLTGPDRSGTGLYALYGLPDSMPPGFTDPASGESLSGQPAEEVLRRISVLLDRTGLELDQFEGLITTGYVGKATIANRNQCKSSAMRLVAASGSSQQAVLNRIHRMVRLRHRLADWSFAQLDRALQACGVARQADESVLVQLASMKRVADRYHVSVDALSVIPAVDAIARFAPAIGLRPFQFRLLAAMAGITGLDDPGAVFDWPALESALLLRQQIEETGLMIEDVAMAALPDAELKQWMQLLPASYRTREQLLDYLVQVQTRLRSVDDVHADLPTRERAMLLLQTELDAGDIAFVAAAIDEAAAEDAIPDAGERVALATSRRDRVVELLAPRTTDGRPPGSWQPLMAEGAARALTDVAVAGTGPVTPTTTAESRYQALLGALILALRRQTLVSALAELSAIPETEAAGMLGGYLRVDDATLAETALLDEGTFWGQNTTIAADSPLIAWCARLHHLLSLRSRVDAARFAAMAPHVTWHQLLTDGMVAGSLQEMHRLLAGWWLGHADRLSMTPLAAALALTSSGTEDDARAVVSVLARRLEFPHDAWSFATFLGMGTCAALSDPTRLKPLYEVMLLARQLKADSAQLTSLVSPVPGDVTSAAVSLLKTRYHFDDETWNASDQRLRIDNSLRSQRRDALVASLLQTPPSYAASLGWRTANDLYEYYLIDPMVEPCMKTTRVLEAITAVQLFCQRILFGLEPALKAPARLRDQWTWMRNYRVWEANRKVFLFPENWLYPELRDDQSSSFDLLRAELGKGELNGDTAGIAYGKFLDDVVHAARIQVLGMYVEGRDDERTLYVIGRTPSPPYAYFSRRCSSYGSRFAEWTPWYRIELDIQGEHLLPYVQHGALHIVWPTLSRKKDENPWTLSYHWSRFDGKKWGKVESSSAVCELPEMAFTTEAESFTFRCSIAANDDVAVYCFASPVLSNPTDVTEPEQGSWSIELSNATQANKTGFIEHWKREGQGYAQNVTPANDGQPVQVYAPAPINWDYINDPDNWTYIDAVNVISWEVWIRARSSNGSTGYVKVTKDPGGYANPLFRLHTTVDEIPFFGRRLGEDLCVWIAGHPSIPAIPRLTCRAVFEERWESAPQSVDSVDGGKFAKTGVRLVITPPETNLPTLSELGIEDPSLLVAVSEHQILTTGESIWRTVSTNMVPAILPGTIFLRNGLKGGGEGSWPLKLPLAGDYAVLPPFKPGSGEFTKRDYWVLGTSDIQSAATGGMVWWYKQGATSTFIDIDGKARPIAAKLIPSGYKEASEIRRKWRVENSLASSQITPMDFGAGELPEQNSAELAQYWQDLKNGKQAFNISFPYGGYNWEIFFHAPLLIADQLSKQNKYEDAERWLRYVFDPTSTGPGADAERFLKFRPFRDVIKSRQRVIYDLKAIAQAAGGYTTTTDIDAIDRIIERWRAMPFRPFVIARGRIVAFLWRTLFAYLDNLIAWADSLYRQDTRESNNEAMMLYVMARRILGRRPKVVSGGSGRPGKTYQELSGRIDDFANYWVDVASRGSMKNRAKKPPKDGASDSPPRFTNGPTSAGMLLFCMPFNDKLRGYWNTVDICLFNLRHCRNIEGIEREVPVTESPIDPELLVRAVAAGLDLGSVVAGLYAPPPHYRYATLAARANELAGEAKALGAAMLSALEKRDAEQMAQLRSTNELLLLRLASDVRRLQIQEADANITALRATRRSTEARYNQYQRLLGLNGNAPPEGQTAGALSMLGQQDSGNASKRSGLGLLKEEDEQYLGVDAANTWATAANISKIAGSLFHLGAAVAAAVPKPTDADVKMFTALGQAGSLVGDAFSFVAQGWRTYADQQGMLAGHLRRRDDWAFQNNQVLKELAQIDKQILANQIRIDITQRELENHLEQIEQSRAVDEVLRSKFTNADLYEWMSRELYGLYDKTYRMALSLARQAERAFERELGPGSLSIPVIRNDHWNSRREGLLAADKLHHDLKRLELAYLDQNRREFELTKHVSLRRLDPEALVTLRLPQTNSVSKAKSNQCEFEIPEWLLDLDTAGHYMRRIKSVSVSIPCVTGPYTSVHCKLTLLGSSVRCSTALNTASGSEYARVKDAEDPRFVDYYGASDAIVTSTATTDSGMFETQLRDERFQPFEGRGVISRWRLELPAEYPQFDYSTISDVVLSIRYTARDGGGDLQEKAAAGVPKPDNGLALPLMISCRTDFSVEWARRKTGMQFELTRELFPYWMGNTSSKPQELKYGILRKSKPGELTAVSDYESLTPSGTVSDPAPIWVHSDNNLGTVKLGVLDDEDIDDVFVILQ